MEAGRLWSSARSRSRHFMACRDPAAAVTSLPRGAGAGSGSGRCSAIAALPAPGRGGSELCRFGTGVPALSGVPGIRCAITGTRFLPGGCGRGWCPGGGCGVGLGAMDPFLILLHSFSSRLSETELSSLKFLLRGKIGKRKLEAAQSGGELFTILLEQQLIASDQASLLEGLFKTINRDDLVAELKQFVEEGEVSASDNQPDVHEKRLQNAAFEVICENVGREWKMLVRKLGLSEVKMERIVAENPFSLREQLFQSLRAWQKWKGKDAKVADLLKALRGCRMNLVADIVEQKLSQLDAGTSLHQHQNDPTSPREDERSTKCLPLF